MVVQHSAEQVVCRGDCVHVAREVQIDVLHRQNLRVAAAGCAALDAEHRTERRLAQRDDRLFADLRHRLTETRRRRRLTLARRRWVNRRDENQLAVRLSLEARKKPVVELRLEAAVRLELLLAHTELPRDLRDGPELCLLGNFNIGKHCDTNLSASLFFPASPNPEKAQNMRF